MLFTLFLAILLAWVVERARIQRQAVAAIQGAGGSVNYNWELTPNPINIRNHQALFAPTPSGRPWAPRWLVDLVGPDFFGSVKVVYLGPQEPDAFMGRVGQLDRLE